MQPGSFGSKTHPKTADRPGCLSAREVSRRGKHSARHGNTTSFTRKITIRAWTRVKLGLLPLLSSLREEEHLPFLNATLESRGWRRWKFMARQSGMSRVRRGTEKWFQKQYYISAAYKYARSSILQHFLWISKFVFTGIDIDLLRMNK